VNADPLVVLVVVVAIGALGALAVLGRMAMERHRLVVRYGHIKSVMAYQEQLRAKQEKVNNSVARPTTFAPAGDTDVAVVKSGPPAAGG